MRTSNLNKLLSAQDQTVFQPYRSWRCDSELSKYLSLFDLGADFNVLFIAHDHQNGSWVYSLH